MLGSVADGCELLKPLRGEGQVEHEPVLGVDGREFMPRREAQAGPVWLCGVYLGDQRCQADISGVDMQAFQEC